MAAECDEDLDVSAAPSAMLEFEELDLGWMPSEPESADLHEVLGPHVPTKEKRARWAQVWAKFLEEEFVSATRSEGMDLQRLYRKATTAKPAGITLFSFPLLSFLMHNTFSIVLILVVLDLVVLASLTGTALVLERPVSVSVANFTISSVRDAQHLPSLANVADIGLAIDSCAVFPRPVQVQRSGASILVTYPRPVEANGWFIELNGTDSRLDPTEVLVSVRNGTKEVRFGSRHCRYCMDLGDRFKDVDGERYGLDPRPERGERTIVHVQSSRLLPMMVIAESAIAVAGFGLVLRSIWRGRVFTAHKILTCTFALIGALAAVEMVIEAVNGRWDGTLLSLRVMLSGLLLALALWNPKAQVYYNYILFIVGALIVGIMHVHEHYSRDALFHYAQELCLGLTLMLSGGCITVHRKSRVKLALQKVREDKTRFDAVWAHVLEDEECSTELGDLLHEIQQCPASKRRKQKPYHHVQSLVSQVGVWKLLGDRPPTLDQIYLQAKACQMLMRDKVLRIAVASDGMLPVAPRRATADCDPQVFVPAAKAMKDEEMLAAVAWTDLKPHERAIEKILHHYNGDSTQLVDVCRETIVFSRICDITRCLRMLLADPSVMIEQIKHTMHPRNDASQSGGFRAVVLKMRFVDGLAQGLAVAGHVCELVLLPRAIAERVSEESCRNYLRLRAVRQLQAVKQKHWRWLAGKATAALASMVPGQSMIRDFARARSGSDCEGHSLEWGRAPSLAPRTSISEHGLPARHPSSPGRFPIRAGRSPPIRAGQLSKRTPSGAHAAGGAAGGASRPALPQTPPMSALAVRRKYQNHAPVVPSLGESEQEWANETLTRQSTRGSSPAEREGKLSQGSVRMLPSAHTISDCINTSALYPDSSSHHRRSRSAPKWDATSSHKLSASLNPREDASARSRSSEQGSRWAHDMFGEVRFEDKAPHRSADAGLHRHSRGRTAGDGPTTVMSGRGGTSPTPSVSRSRMRMDALVQSSQRLLASSKDVVLRLRMPDPDVSIRTSDRQDCAVHNRTDLTPVADPVTQLVEEFRSMLRERGRELNQARELNQTRASTKKGKLHGFTFFLEQFRSRVQSEQLQSKAKSVEVAFCNATTIAVLDSSFPVLAALSKRAFVRLLLLVSLVCLVGTVLEAMQWSTRGLHSATALRFTVRELRGGVVAGPETPALFGAVGVLQEGCHVPLEAARVSEDMAGSQWTMRLDHDAAFSGFFFQTANASADRDPVKFEVAASSDGSEWTTVGASGFGVTLDHRKVWSSTRAWNTPQGRGHLVEMDDRAQAEQLGVVFSTAAMSLTTFAMVVAAYLHRFELGPRFLVAGTALVAAGVAVYGAIITAGGHYFGFCLHWVGAGAIVVGAWVLWKRQRMFVGLMLCVFPVFLLIALLEAWLLPIPFAQGFEMPLRPLAISVAGLVLYALRWRTQQQSLRRILKDKEAYDALWEQVMEDKKQERRLGEIEAVVTDMSPFLYKEDDLRQSFRQNDDDVREASAGRRWSVLSIRSAATFDDVRRPSAASLGGSHLSRPVSTEDDPPATSPFGSLRMGLMQRVTQTQRFVSRLSSTGSQYSNSGNVLVRGTSDGEQGESGRWGEVARSQEGGRVRDRLPSELVRVDRPPSMERRFSLTPSPEPSESRPQMAMGEASLEEGDGAPREPLLSLTPTAAGARSRRSLAEEARMARQRPSRRRMDSRVRHPSVKNLDQLYVQAAGVWPLLRAKAQEWAMFAHGSFKITADETAEAKGARGVFVRWDEAEFDASLHARIKWAGLKSPERAVEKLMRSYKHDVSKLLDVCRQSIVLEQLADVAYCLRIIASDPAVHVLSVKNRLSPTYDAWGTVGYRDVNLTLRIVTDEAVRLNLDLHLCELQLLLRPFAELKSDDGHARYVAFRNARGK